MDIIRVRYDKGRKILVADSVNWAGVGLTFLADDIFYTSKRLSGTTGVYILVAYEPVIMEGKQFTDSIVYIGESVQLYARIQSQMGSLCLRYGQDFRWERIYAFYGADNRLTGTHALHLEHRLLQLAQGRCTLKNDKINEGEPGGSNELTTREAEMFLVNLIEAAKLLGINFLEQTPKEKDKNRDKGKFR